MTQKIKIALLIGINYIGTSSELGGCINDTENLKVFLQKNHKIRDEYIKIMSDNESDNMKPTKANIETQLNSLVAFANRHNYPNREVMIFVSYSGHGYQVRNEDNDNDDYERDGLDEVICPLDYPTNGFIKDDYLKKEFVDKLNSNVKLVMLMDCCNSGTIVDLKYEYLLDRRRTLITHGEARETQCNVTMISGCRDDQTSADAWLKDYETRRYESQGALTASFIACYKDKATYEGLVYAMRRWLKNGGFTQLPQLSSSKRINTRSRFLLSFYK